MFSLISDIKKDIKKFKDLIKQEMKEAKFLYCGRYFNVDQVKHLYWELDENDEYVSEWRFDKKIFSKGGVGSVYSVEIEDRTVSYSKKQYPTTLVKQKDSEAYCSSFMKFSKLETFKELDRQVEVTLKNSKVDSLVYLEVDKIREVYSRLHGRQKQAFIAELIRKIVG